MESCALRCAVTGASGYVGSRVSEYFAARGWTVFELTRARKHQVPGRIHIPFQLDSAINPALLRKLDIRALIHCAYDFRAPNWEYIHRVNVQGSVRLLRAAEEAGIGRIILLSSISAFDGCDSLYGKAKLEIEKAAAAVGACIIRSGLVYGNGSQDGMFGSMWRAVRESRIVPLIGSGKYIQYLVHEDDLCELLLRVSNGSLNLLQLPIVAASPRGWRIRDLLQVMATAQQGRVMFLPLPWRVVWVGLKMAELLRVTVPFRSDSVVSLVRQNPKPDFSLIDQVGFTFRDFSGCS